ncbi:ABC transporter [Tistrella bauzanensis]|uniref:ABC transporter n=1 Tax=Tistrella bauzanensis TaxID=657419 RepID=A0ABQ1J519_9PROT|nr:ABC transporter ATP-binding protein [Tistrella bauzanensis]GGB58843.1 ABC transporter [Tistrella bauzanensis]
MPDTPDLSIILTGASPDHCHAGVSPDHRHAGDAPPAVDITDVRVRPGGRLVLDGCGLTLPAGRITALLGASGSGKTTLMRLIAGLDVAGLETGRVTASDGRPLDGRIAWMAQQDLLMPWARVIDNVTLGDRLRGRPVDAPRAHAMLDAVGLAGTARLRPAALSGGMRQRVALARTLMEDRPVVLMDEPFGALDAVTRHGLQDLACRLLRGRTVLLVTHDPLEALRMGENILVLSGRPAVVLRVTPPPGAVPRPVDAPDLGARLAGLMAVLEARP